MKSLALALLMMSLAACSPQGDQQNPRDRQGVDGALTWRLVSQSDSQAAFLSRPGAAPDIVLWCRDGAKIVLRAHIFDTPAPRPDLQITTTGGVLVLTDVRRQGGVRAGDRQLVEGSGAISDPRVRAVLIAADNFVLKSGADTYQVESADPAGILEGFITSCAQMTLPSPP